MTETREFHIGDILSVTTGRLVSPGHMAGVHAILDWMTGESLFTHSLPRACRECEPSLRAQFPDLAAVTVPEELDGETAVLLWLEGQVIIHGDTREVARLDPADHTHINPFTELRMINPDAAIIAIEVPPGDDND